MPTLKATDGLASGANPEFIKRVDLTPESILNMTDEELTATFALIRKARETGPSRSVKEPRTPKEPKVVTSGPIEIEDEE